MSNYSYTAVDPQGSVSRGTLEVSDQYEALRRIREMGLFPTELLQAKPKRPGFIRSPRLKSRTGLLSLSIPLFGRRIKASSVAVFTRQLATLIDAGMPLLRGLRTLQEQEESPAMKRLLEEVSTSIESGSSLAEAIAQHPKAFNSLYMNMVKAGEISGALEVTLTRLAEYIEKARKIAGKVKSAMIYPCAVLLVASGLIVLLLTYVVPRFKAVFDGLSGGVPMPRFSQLVFDLGDAVKNHLGPASIALASLVLLFAVALRIESGRYAFDWLKLRLPVLGNLFKKAAISRFSRTLGTLVSSGVPILQALTIVKDTAGNRVVSHILSDVHESVKQGEPIAPTLRTSRLFPAMVAGMVDVGEQTGSLPELLMKIADTYDGEVDNSVSALTSLLEPVLIIFLAVVVGGIVIAMFMPLIAIITGGGFGPSGEGSN
jgi:type IV pilus assembly protein PilC